MTRSFRALTLAACSFLIVGPVPGATSDRTSNLVPEIQQGNRLAVALHQASGVPALSVAVGVGGRIVWSEGFGVANLETPSPVTAETRFRCASVSKVVTVAVLARLAARGTINLDAPIQTYLPTYPAAPKPITLRLLSGHLGGIRHYLPKDLLLAPKRYGTLGEALPIFAGDPLVAPPGERYNYSTYGFTLIGAALEAATGKSFLDLVRDEVSGPLDLRHTGGDLRPDVLPGRAAIYDRGGDGAIRLAAPDDLSLKWPGGGLLSTPEDLVRFGFAHLSGDYLSAAARAPLFVSQKTMGGEETGVGIGWRVGRDWRGRVIYHHSGAQAGARSTLLLYPDEGVVVAIMTNLGNSLSGIEPSAQMLAEPFLADGVKPAAAEMPTGALPYRGTFRKSPVTGVLLLARTAGELHGALSVPEALATALRAQGFEVGTTFPLVRGFANGTGVTFATATPFGLLPLRLERGDKGIHGALVLGGETLELDLE